MQNQSKPIEQRHILQSNENVFEMKRQDVRLTIIALVAFIFIAVMFSLGVLYFRDGSIPFESTQLVLNDLPKFIDDTKHIILFSTALLTLVFLYAANKSPIYVKITKDSVTTKTSLRNVFNKGPVHYQLASQFSLKWMYVSPTMHRSAKVYLEMATTEGEKKIHLSDGVFGFFGLKSLIDWLQKHLPEKKIT